MNRIPYPDETRILLVLWPYASYDNGASIFSDATAKWYIALE